jgi:hypothetical protein
MIPPEAKKGAAASRSPRAALARIERIIEQAMTRDLDGWLDPPDCAWRLPLPRGQVAVPEPDKGGEHRLVVKMILDAEAVR